MMTDHMLDCKDILNQAKSALKENRNDDALKYYQLAEKNCPENANVSNNIGVILYYMQQYDQAKKAFLKALDIDPYYFDALLNLTNLAVKTDDYLLAHKTLRRCIQIEPFHRDVVSLQSKIGGDRIIIEKSRRIDFSKFEEVEFFNDYAAIPTPDDINDDLMHLFVNKDALSALNGVKILHAPFEIAGIMGKTTQLLRKLGVYAKSANYFDSWLKYTCDINLSINNLPENKARKAIENFAQEAIEEYDIFHFHFARSLFPDFHDLEILKNRGKKIIFQFWGFDSRSPEIYFYNQAKFLGFNPPKPFYLTVELYKIHKLINRYADVLLGPGWIPRGLWISGMADLSSWSLEEKERLLKKSSFIKEQDKTYFLHAPTVNWKKGSKILLSLLEECRNDGMPIEIIYVDKMIPEKAKEVYANADFAVDMIGHGSFGLFGFEMMAWGIPVLVYQNELHDRIREYPPVIKITKENFKNQIQRCIDIKNRGQLAAYGKITRNYAIRSAEMRICGIPDYIELYSKLIRGEKISQLFNRAWYEQEFLLESQYKSSFYKYMSDNGVFKKIGVDVNNYDKRLYESY